MQPEELNSLILIVGIAALTPWICEWIPGIRLPLVVLEIGLGIIVGPQVLGWASVGPVVGVLANFGLALLFFLAGFEIDFPFIHGRPLIVATLGWLVSFGLGLAAGLALQGCGLITSGVFVGAAMTTTALGTLMPILRDAQELPTRFGAYAVASGAVGEFGPIVLIATLLSTGQGAHSGSIWLLILFTAITVAGAFVALRFRPHRIVYLMQAKMHTSAQLPVRLSLLILLCLVFLAKQFALDAILGAIAAGVLVARMAPGAYGEALRHKLEGIGFGCFVPIFFVATGLRYDLNALLSSRSALLQLPLFLLLFLVVRGLPACLARVELDTRSRLALGLVSATQLPLVVAIVDIGRQAGRINAETAASLVGAGMASVLLFPFAALLLRQSSRPSGTEPADADNPGKLRNEFPA